VRAEVNKAIHAIGKARQIKIYCNYGVTRNIDEKDPVLFPIR